MLRSKISMAVGVAITLASGVALATNGYAPHGIGQKAKGMGGAGIAFPQDTLAGGMNPAGMVWVGDRLDVGLEWFRPQREAEITGMGKFDGNDKENFFVPEFGYNYMVDPNLSGHDPSQANASFAE